MFPFVLNADLFFWDIQTWVSERAEWVFLSPWDTDIRPNCPLPHSRVKTCRESQSSVINLNKTAIVPDVNIKHHWHAVPAKAAPTVTKASSIYCTFGTLLSRVIHDHSTGHWLAITISQQDIANLRWLGKPGLSYAGKQCTRGVRTLYALLR